MRHETNWTRAAEPAGSLTRGVLIGLALVAPFWALLAWACWPA